MNASGTRKNWSKPVADIDWARLVRESNDLVLLDDASARGRSFLFRNPAEVLRARSTSDLPRLMQRLDRARAEGLHVAGYVNYEAVQDEVTETSRGPVNDFASHSASNPEETLAWFGIYDKRELVDTSRGWPRGGAARAFSMRPSAIDSLAGERSRFYRDLRRIREHLARGDVYQINYTLESRFDFQGDPAALFAYLRRLQPAAHCALLKTADAYILSLSPELFFRARMEADGSAMLETRPIKGTAPRANPPGGAEDAALREGLREDEKTRAENLMITDLMRNDLGRHARPGSVRVPELFALESLPGLHQMYSVIRGDLDAPKARRLFQDVFPALFPCGSVTGAPKSAAREIIHALEQRPRGVYTGAVGFAGPDQAVFSVAIRTLEIERGDAPVMNARLGCGCGIVWDSKPRDEWRERLLKQSFLVPALDDFRVIETMLLSNGRVLFARRHALRLTRALRRFRIPGHYRRLRNAIQETVMENARGHFRLRMTVDRGGHYEIALRPLPRGMNTLGVRRGADRSELGVRLVLSREHVWSGNPFRRYKTTERALYDDAFAEAVKGGYDDALFLNERLEVVETCTANILILVPGEGWITPSGASGALPGTLLAYLENKYPARVRRRKIKLRDLRNARFAFVCNSVRGLRRIIALHGPGEKNSHG